MRKLRRSKLKSWKGIAYCMMSLPEGERIPQTQNEGAREGGEVGRNYLPRLRRDVEREGASICSGETSDAVWHYWEEWIATVVHVRTSYFYRVE